MIDKVEKKKRILRGKECFMERRTAKLIASKFCLPYSERILWNGLFRKACLKPLRRKFIVPIDGHLLSENSI